MDVVLPGYYYFHLFTLMVMVVLELLAIGEDESPLDGTPSISLIMYNPGHEYRW